MAKDAVNEICRRIAELRAAHAGPRGKSNFAKQLGIAASTYDYYEHDRTPPAETLVRMAEVTGADLHWLLTGKPAPTPLASEDQPLLQRITRLLADCPDAAGPLEAFVDILAQARQFPDKSLQDTAAGVTPDVSNTNADTAGEPTRPPATRPARRDQATSVRPTAPPASARSGRESWIPILGRTAAGVTMFWGKGEDVTGLTTLGDLVARHAGQTPRAVQPAIAENRADEAPTPPAATWLVTLSSPDERNAVEFVAAEAIKRRHPDAFALRVDGNSMSPDIRQSDVVVLSPSVPAVEGQPAVVQLAGQIGVTCKLYRTAGEQVHLVPINANYEIAAAPAEQVEWALRVIARVRG